MDDEFHQLEAELKRLRPAVPAKALLARLQSELAPTETVARAAPPSRATRAWWLWAGALPAAAALVLAFVFLSRREAGQAPAAPAMARATGAAARASEVFKPVAAENVLYAVSDEGLVTLDDGTSARRERLSYVDTITWKNPRTNASVRWTVPREEVRVVPVKFQ